MAVNFHFLTKPPKASVSRPRSDRCRCRCRCAGKGKGKGKGNGNGKGNSNSRCAGKGRRRGEYWTAAEAPVRRLTGPGLKRAAMNG